MKYDDVRFLEVWEVIALHDHTIARHGGRDGILDRGRLESAVNTPAQIFATVVLHYSIAGRLRFLPLPGTRVR